MIHITPAKMLKIIDRALLPVVLISVVWLVYGLYLALVKSPMDYQQGNAVRIMYVHVPSAWLALMIYSAIAFLSICGFIWKNILFNIIAISAAPIGAAFALITLVTGSIWGKPMWGTWWVWDARLTSMLILFFLYIGYIALYKANHNIVLGSKLASILAIVGFINIPIIKFSVEIWHTLHQPASIIRKGGLAIAPSMMAPLMVMFVGLASFALIIVFLNLRTYIHARKNLRIN